MNPSRHFFVGTAFVFIFLFTIAVPSAFAKPPVNRNLIAMVDLPTNSVEIKSFPEKSSHVYTIDARTVVTVNNSPGTIANISPGMKVTDYVERDANTLNSITLEGAGATSKTKRPNQ
jgi:hypothetical protein